VKAAWDLKTVCGRVITLIGVAYRSKKKSNVARQLASMVQLNQPVEHIFYEFSHLDSVFSTLLLTLFAAAFR